MVGSTMKKYCYCQCAKSFKDRFFGMLGKKDLNTPLFFPNCRSIHTFFMPEPITLVWVDQDFEIMKIEENVPPNRIRFCPKAFGVFEFRSSEAVKEMERGKTLFPHFHQDESGQALVEAAILLPLFILLVFGFLQLGLALSEKQKLAYTANYATQVGSLTNNDQKISGAVEESFSPTEISLSILTHAAVTQNEISSSERRYNDFLTVQLQKDFNLQIPFLSLSAWTLEAKSSARILCNNPTFPYVCQ